VHWVKKAWKQFHREAIPVARCTVVRPTSDLGLQAVMRGRPLRTTLQNALADRP